MSELAYSLEVEGLIALVGSFGLPHRITDVNTPNVHSAGGYHYKTGTGGPGLAIDVAWEKSYWLHPVQAKTGMLAICAALKPYESMFAELICSHLPYSIKNGQRVARYAYWSHLDHIHVAVPRGVILAAKPVTKAEAMARVVDPVAAHRRPGAGPEQFAIIARDGSMWAFNGAPYCSAYNAHPHLWNGPTPNTNRAAVDFEWDTDGWGYTQYFDDSAFYHWRAEGH